jgi:hypothetical protein
MFRRKVVFSLAVCLLAAAFVGQSLSQPQQRGQRGQRGGAQGAQRPQMQGRQFDPERMRQMMEQRMQEQLGATDQEWKVLGPRVMKVSELSRQSSGFGRGGMFGGGMFGGRRGQGGPQGNRFGGGPGAPARELTAVEKASEQLSTLLENSSSTSEQIKKQLTVLRAAKEKAKQELAVAQKELREIVTVRQEGRLVLMGMLD